MSHQLCGTRGKVVIVQPASILRLAQSSVEGCIHNTERLRKDALSRESEHSTDLNAVNL